MIDASVDDLAQRMQGWGYLETPAPPAALRWIGTFLDAYRNDLRTLDEAQPAIAALRAEACIIPALELERLRTRDVLFFLDTVAQYVDHAPELRDLPVMRDVVTIGSEFAIAPEDALLAVRLAITGQRSGPSLEHLFVLLGHDRLLMRIGAVNSKLLHGRGLEPIRYGPDGSAFEPIRAKRQPPLDPPV